MSVSTAGPSSRYGRESSSTSPLGSTLPQPGDLRAQRHRRPRPVMQLDCELIGGHAVGGVPESSSKSSRRRSEPQHCVLAAGSASTMGRPSSCQALSRKQLRAQGPHAGSGAGGGGWRNAGAGPRWPRPWCSPASGCAVRPTSSPPVRSSAPSMAPVSGSWIGAAEQLHEVTCRRRDAQRRRCGPAGPGPARYPGRSCRRTPRSDESAPSAERADPLGPSAQHESPSPRAADRRHRSAPR